MKIFEFQFNPKQKKDRFFRVFAYEPKDETQEEQGSLYVIGELQNSLPVNASLLQTIADRIYKEYVAAPQGRKKTFSPTVGLKISLRKANEFLAAESKKGNVDWLGNLHMAIVLFVPTDNAYTMYFTKIQGIKVWMARNGSLVDIGMNIEKERDEGSTKVFGNVGSGKIISEDRIAVVTEELFESFTKENLSQKISQFKEEKQFKDVFKSKEKILSKTAGVLVFFLIEPFVRHAEGQPIEESSSLPLKFPSMPKFGVSMPSLPSMSALKNSGFPLSAIKSSRVPHVSLPKIAISVPEFVNPKTKLSSFQNIPPMKKALGLLCVLVIILGIGFAIFKGNSSPLHSPDSLAALEAAEILQFQAEQALAGQNEDEANRLFQQAWGKIAPYQDNQAFQALKQEVETQLQKLNNVEFIGNPDVFLTLDISQIPETPKKVLLAAGSLYFFDPFSSELIAVEIVTKSQAILSPGRNLKFGETFNDSFLFFADPNILISFNETNGWQEHQVLFPNGFTPGGLASFGTNIYLFDGNMGQIVLTKLNQANASLWVEDSSAKKPLDAQSIAIDGNIWVLKKGGEIQRYFRGRYEESLSARVFPALDSTEKIFTRAALPYLYILDKANARVLVMTKFGDIVRQYQSPAFKDATDFVVSVDGDVLYILAKEKVYRLENILEDE